MIILMRAPFLPKFSSLCMCGIRSCGCRGTSSLQTSRSASSDRRFQHPRVPLEGPEKFSRVALLYNFYTDYFTSPRIIYRALFSALSSFSIQKKGCSLIKLATLLIVPSTLSTETERRNAFKKKFLFFFFMLQRLHEPSRVFSSQTKDAICFRGRDYRHEIYSLNGTTLNTKVKLLT